MVNIKKIKITQWVITIVLFVSIIIVRIRQESQSCMGVALIPENKLADYTKTLEVELDEIVFNGKKAAVDIERNTVYISQSMNRLWHNSALQGSIEIKDTNYKLYFIDNMAMKDIESSVRNGIPLSLAIVSKDSMCMVDVVITTLPVMSINGEYLETDVEGRDNFAGDMTVWAGCDPLTEEYSIKSSEVRWRKRGNFTARKEKNSLKLSLVDQKGNNNVNLLGLGSDDDWILNSMVMDDTKMKEKLFMDTWNEMAETSDYNYKMSKGEYVEAVVNGRYMGLYLLQRRVDAKYLELSKDDVLLKVTRDGAKNIKEAYEIVNQVEDPNQIYSFMQKIFDKTDCSDINIDNFIDVNIMLTLTNGIDNESMKNMFFLLKKVSKGYEVFLIPWDTDMTMGTIWSEEENDYIYDYQQAMENISQRYETESISNSAFDYNGKMRSRWKDLKQTLFSDNKLMEKVDILEKKLSESCSLQREKECWEENYAGEDNVENLKRFLLEKSKKMDLYYQ